MVTTIDKTQLDLAIEFAGLVSDELLDLVKIAHVGGDRLTGIIYKTNNLNDALSKIAVEKKEKIVKPPVEEPKPIEEPVTPESEPEPVKTFSYKKKKSY